MIVNEKVPAKYRTDEWYYNCEYDDNWTGFILGTGSIAIIAGVAVAAAAVVAIIIIKKKKTAASK